LYPALYSIVSIQSSIYIVIPCPHSPSLFTNYSRYCLSTAVHSLISRLFYSVTVLLCCYFCHLLWSPPRTVLERSDDATTTLDRPSLFRFDPPLPPTSSPPPQSVLFRPSIALPRLYPPVARNQKCSIRCFRGGFFFLFRKKSQRLYSFRRIWNLNNRPVQSNRQLFRAAKPLASLRSCRRSSELSRMSPKAILLHR
jgi:hypothetical protein